MCRLADEDAGYLSKGHERKWLLKAKMQAVCEWNAAWGSREWKGVGGYSFWSIPAWCVCVCKFHPWSTNLLEFGNAFHKERDHLFFHLRRNGTGYSLRGLLKKRYDLLWIASEFAIPRGSRKGHYLRFSTATNKKWACQPKITFQMCGGGCSFLYLKMKFVNLQECHVRNAWMKWKGVAERGQAKPILVRSAK